MPGTWVLPPMAGMLWTPPYWGWADGAYVFHAGYWGPSVGYYGGVDYGFGYGGVGYQGGHSDGANFVYNRSANNFGSMHVTHVYDQKVTVTNNSKVNYAGGAGGLRNEPTAEERSAEHDRHVPATTQQTKHITAAAKSPALAASHNRGRPAIAAASRPAQFKGPGVVPARPESAGERAASHPAEAALARPAAQRPAEAASASSGGTASSRGRAAATSSRGR